MVALRRRDRVCARVSHHSGCEVSVKSERHAVLEVNPRDRFSGEVLGIQHRDVTLSSLSVVDDAEHEPLVLGSVGRARHEDRLAWVVQRAEVVSDNRAAGAVLAGECRSPRTVEARGARERVEEPVLIADKPVVQAREFGAAVVELGFLASAARQVELV